MPNKLRPNDDIPIIIRMGETYPGYGIFDNLLNGEYRIFSDKDTNSQIINLYHGAGSLLFKNEESNTLKLYFADSLNFKTIILDNTVPIKYISEDIEADQTWEQDTIYYIMKRIDILRKATLVIEEGTRIYIAPKTNIISYGRIISWGKEHNPIIFSPLIKDSAWGGVELIKDSFFQYTIFYNGGADTTRKFGHSKSQPVVFSEDCNVGFNNCFFIYNEGKALGLYRSKINIDFCLFSDCDSGGEFTESSVSVNNSYILNMPSNDTAFIDDDNDGFYFNSTFSNETNPSTINNCVFVNGKDDAIDHNGAKLEVKNCWIENFKHEGIACSFKNFVNVSNTVIMNCEQGIESGYGSPEVNVNHCVIINNDVGLRFGDSYDWGCNGHLSAKNSILYNNSDNILNYDLLLKAPVDGGIDISYSITNDEEYDSYSNCLTGIPDFDELYFLTDNSIGKGLADDGYDLGLIKKEMFVKSNECKFKIFPNPASNIFYIVLNNYKPIIEIFDVLGDRIKFSYYFYDKSVGEQLAIIDSSCIPGGLYLIRIIYFDKVITETIVISH
ncbi:MAG: T9SS type A sorting domain-containing protein [bacterium]